MNRSLDPSERMKGKESEHDLTQNVPAVDEADLTAAAVEGDAAVIPQHKIFVIIQRHPIFSQARVCDLRKILIFLIYLSVNINNAVSDFYSFSGQTDDPFNVNRSIIAPVLSKSNNIAPVGTCKFVDQFIDKKSLQNHIETHNGVEYQVVDFHKIKDDEDLGQYGFMRGRTKKDVQFLVHMVDTKNAKKNLTAVKHLSSPVNGGVLSESLITPYHKRTYENRKYGLILSQINANVMNAKKINQGSGYEKDLSSINYLVFGENAEARKNFRHEFLLNLGIDPDSVSDKEFGEFYKNNIIAKSSFNQFVSGKEYTLGTKTITGEDIKQAIIKFQDSLIDKKEQNHNEIVGYVPKLQAVVAKERSLSSIPDEILEFAKENNLPVVLI